MTDEIDCARHRAARAQTGVPSPTDIIVTRRAFADLDERGQYREKSLKRMPGRNFTMMAAARMSDLVADFADAPAAFRAAGHQRRQAARITRGSIHGRDGRRGETSARECWEQMEADGSQAILGSARWRTAVGTLPG